MRIEWIKVVGGLYRSNCGNWTIVRTHRGRCSARWWIHNDQGGVHGYASTLQLAQQLAEDNKTIK